ncbi:MAG TPA: hypothetical protein VJ917_07740 [Saprospiraceae bacterium]|nr:hypothetical protein [Saprospiraceae bacterium]
MKYWIFFLIPFLFLSCEEEEGTDWLAVYSDLLFEDKVDGMYVLESYEVFDRLYETDSCSVMYFHLEEGDCEWWEVVDCQFRVLKYAGDFYPLGGTSRVENSDNRLYNIFTGQSFKHDFYMRDMLNHNDPNIPTHYHIWIEYVDEERLEFEVGNYDIDGDGIYLEEVRFNWRKR